MRPDAFLECGILAHGFLRLRCGECGHDKLLAALVPRPRLHLIRFPGVLAPNAKLRALVVPQGPEVQEQATEISVADGCEVETVQDRPHRISWARLLKRVLAAT